MPRSEKLTPKQLAFVQQFLVDHNATQAAIRAGYSAKTAQEQGSRLLSKVMVQAELDKRTQKQEKRLEITSDYVLTGIRDLVERCIQAEEVFDKDGNKLGIYQFEPQAALKGYELLGKHKKLFTEKREVSFDLGRLSDEQLEELDNQLGPDSPNPTGNPARA